jgi:hypothetical protein
MRLASLLFVLALAGCKNSVQTQSSTCDSITGGSSQFTSSCTSCAIATPSAAADGNLNTSADITPNSGATGDSATMRATAQSGIVFPAGSKPGVMLTQPRFDSTANDVITYMNGAMQERLAGNSTAAIKPGGGQAAAYFTFTSTKQFNAVEFTTTNTWPSGQSPVYRIYELCSNGGAP